MIQAVSLNEALNRMLSQIKTDRFGGRAAPVVTAAPGTDVDAAGVLHGALDVHIVRTNGEKALICRQSLDGIADEDGLRDALAEGLSKALARHDKWPR